MEAEEEGEGHWETCWPPLSSKATTATPLFSAAPSDATSSATTGSSSSREPSSQIEQLHRQQWSGGPMDEPQQRAAGLPSSVSAAQNEQGSAVPQHQQIYQLPSRQQTMLQQRFAVGAEQLQHQRLEEPQAGSGRSGGLLRSFSSLGAGESGPTSWKRNLRRWMKGVVLYARCRPLLFFSFIFFSAAHVLLSVAFLHLFPCPLLLTWAQLSQSVFYAFVLGEAGDTFPVFRLLFPSTSHTLQRAYAAVAAAGARTRARPSAVAEGGATSAEKFWRHKTGLLLQLLLRLLPYSLGYCLLQYANNVLAAHVQHPLQLPIVASLALASHELLHSVCARVRHSATHVLRLRRDSDSGGSPFEVKPGNKTAAEAAGPPTRDDRAALPGGLPAIAEGSDGGGAGSSATATGETELSAAMTLSSSGQRNIPDASTASLHVSASPSNEEHTAGGRCWLLPSSSTESCFAVVCSRLVQALSLLLLGVAPAGYMYWCSSSPFFSGPAGLFVLASLIYRSWLLPKALHLTRSSSIRSKSSTGQQQDLALSRFRSRPGGATASSATQSASFSSPSLSFPSFTMGRSTSFVSPAAAAAAARVSYFRPKEISLLQNITGTVVLLLPGLFCGEQHYTTFPFRFLLSYSWDEWLAAGCWISLGTVAFLRKVTSSSIMREAGAPVWKAAELLAVVCVGCFSCVAFGNPDPAAFVCCSLVVLGRLLGLAAASPAHHHHHLHRYGVQREQQQQQPWVLHASSTVVFPSMRQTAADTPVLHNSSNLTDTAPLGLSSNDHNDVPQPALTDGSRRNGCDSSSSGSRGESSSNNGTRIGNSAAAGCDRNSGSSSSSSQTPGERGESRTLPESFTQLATRSFSMRSISRSFGSRDDTQQFVFPHRGSSTAFDLWNAEAAAAAAAAELPSVRLLEEPDIFLRPPHRGTLAGRRFVPGIASSASLGGFIYAPSRRGSMAGITWDRSGTQALLAEGGYPSRKLFPTAHSVLAVIGEEEEEEGKDGPSPGLALSLDTQAAAAGERAPVWPREAEGEDEEEPDEEEAAAATTREFLMDIVRAYVSRTAIEDLLLLEQWGGTTGVAAAVGADLLQGFPDERRRASGISSSSEDELESTTDDDMAEVEEQSAAMVAACTPPLLSSATADRPVQRHRGYMSSFAEPQVADVSAGPLGHPAAATGGPGGYPPPRRRPRRRLHKRQQQEPYAGETKARGVGQAEGGAEGEELAEGGEQAEEWEDGEVVREQRRLYGMNRLPRRPLSSFFSLCMEAASDATLRVLMLCGLMSLVLALLFSKEPETEVIEGLAIWVAVLVVVLVTAGNDWMKEQQFALLSAVKEDKKCSVIRGGEAKQLSVFDLVVGDLLQLEAGDEIPADALLVQGRDVKVDESSLTGESEPIAKEPYLVCMQEATAVGRHEQQQQPQQRETPLLLPLQKKQTQRNDAPHHQQQREEEGGSVAASTAAESVAVPVGSPSHVTVLHDATHASAPPSSSSSSSCAHRSSAPDLFASGSSADASSAEVCPPGSAEGDDDVLDPTAPGTSCSLAAALLPFSFSSSSSVAAEAPAPSSRVASAALLARHHAVPSPVLLSGTTLSTGSCTALVVAVGPYSQVGQTFQKLAFDPEPTPLQMKLNALAEDIGNFGLAAALVAFVVLLAEFWLLFWMQPPQARAELGAVDILHEHVEFFVTAITILVVAVPEGLPLAVTISLAYSISQMLRDQNYVRRLAACEIMGGANEICSDKTGTLTKNQMAVTVFWSGDCPSPPRKEGTTPLLLEVPASVVEQGLEDQQQAAAGNRVEGSAIPMAAWEDAAGSASGKDAVRDRYGDVGSAREERSRATEERTAAGFSKEYTKPLLEADPTARTTARSTEAATTGRTTAGAPARAEGQDSTATDKSSRYAAWMEGERDRQQQHKWLLLAEAIAVNSTAFLEKEEDQDLAASRAAEEPDGSEPAPPPPVRYKHVGSPTECALLAFSTFQCHYNYASLRKQILGEEDRYLLERREFTSDRKMMTSIVRLGPEAIGLEERFVLHQRRTQHTVGSQQQMTPEAGGREEQPRPLQGATEGGIRVFVKGAAERVLRQCSRVLVSDTEAYALTPALVSTIEEKVINNMAGRALRTICIAYKDIPPDASTTPAGSPQRQRDDLSSGFPTTSSTVAADATPSESSPASASAGATALDASGFDAFERELVCLGIAGIEDPVREEVPGAVLQCQAAGIRVRMVTGDNLLTAAAIATQCNIYHEAAGGLAMLGSDFMRCIGGVVCQRCGTAVCNCATDSKTAEEEGRPLRVDVIKNLEAFQDIWQRLEVLARSQPTDKYALVCALQQLHRVVAVTGDGTNDAPALRKADVGFAMGLSGKEVAKQAADIVMLDDNFTCIVKAVRWGRSVYDNIRRFLQFQLTVNVVAVLLTVTCVAVEREAPLSAVQMLWINLIMDSFASLALATEPPTDALLRRKPHGRDSYLVSRTMLASIISAACYQVVVILVLIFYGENLLPETSWKFVAQQQRLKLNFCEFSDGVPEQCVGRRMVSGRRYKVFSTEEDYKSEWQREFGPSRHKTFVFNTFVFMQIFNMLAARDVDDEGPSSSLLQLGTAMLRNKLGLSVWLFILLAQILMTELGGRVLGCHFDVSQRSNNKGIQLLQQL